MSDAIDSINLSLYIPNFSIPFQPYHPHHHPVYGPPYNPYLLVKIKGPICTEENETGQSPSASQNNLRQKPHDNARIGGQSSPPSPHPSHPTHNTPPRK